MHVMEDVEEGSDVSGALPSSPGHAEQRPDPPKTTTEVSTSPTAEPTAQTDTTVAPSPSPPPPAPTPPTQNGLPAEDSTAITEKPKSPEEVHEEHTSSEVIQVAKESSTVAQDISEPDKSAVNESEIGTKPNSPGTEDSTKESQIRQENEEDSTSNDSSAESNQNKRKLEDDDNISPMKRLRSQVQQEYVNHDRILNEYIENSGCGTVEEIQAHTEQLLAEIRTLNELAREKEREWNNILHIKKVKEELLLRMQRRRRVLIINNGGTDSAFEWSDMSANEQEIMERAKDGNKTGGGPNTNSGVMMMSGVATAPAGYASLRSNSRDSSSKSDRHQSSKPRPILPKPSSVLDLNGQSECRQGRQGPILDVRSIIADYRQRHPETVPRRGRRLKSVLNTAQNEAGSKMSNAGGVLSMASLALGSGSQVRHGTVADVSNDLGLLLSAMDSARQENSRPSSADSSIAGTVGGDPTMSFKDVLTQFARLSQSERQELQAQAAASFAAAAAAGKPPPPPYPEVTLHPVLPVASTGQTAAAAAASTQNNSLLHGILTKGQARTESKPATFSPTLARLLTAPERVSNNSAQAMYATSLSSGVSLDLLSTGKSNYELTITPVGHSGQNMKHKDGDHVEEDEAEDSADRLVIDESGEGGSASDRNRTDNGSEAGDEVPQCQGCHQKSAQFVCAGCGNQWYCSRDCQVAAWDEHSEVCSG